MGATPPDVARVANPFGIDMLNLPHEQMSFVLITQDEAADSSFDVHSLQDDVSVTSFGSLIEEWNEHPRHEGERKEDMPIDRLHDVTPDYCVSNYDALSRRCVSNDDLD